MLGQLLSSLQAKTQAYQQGEHTSPYFGDGIEKSEIRPYVTGDSIRHINRKQSTKGQDRYTNLYQKEQQLDVHLYADININWTQGHTRPYIQDISPLRNTIWQRTQHHHHQLTLYTPAHVYSTLHQNISSQTFANTYQEQQHTTSTLALQHTTSDLQHKVIIYISDFAYRNEQTLSHASLLTLHNTTIGIQIPLYSIGNNYCQYDDIHTPTPPSLHHHFTLGSL